MDPRLRFARLPEKDREYINSWVAMRPEINEDVATLFHQSKSILQANLSGIRTRPERKGYAYQSKADLLPGELGSLADQVLQHGIANRLLHESPVLLANSLFMASRLQYLANLAKTPTYTSGSDCNHIFDVLLSLAANDTQAVGAYLRKYTHRATRGHTFTALLYNSFTALFRGQTLDLSVEQLLARNDGIYDRAMLVALVAIAECDTRLLDEKLHVMLSGHRRKTINGGLLRYFAVPVHAIFRMACNHFQAAAQPLPKAPTDTLWDADVHARQQEPESTGYLEHIRILSPTIAEWSIDLPESVDPELFVDLLQR